MSVEFDPKNMLFRNLGNSGLRVPVFSYGGWLTVGAEQKGSIVNELMKTAFECGINMFDNAEAYAAGESEKEMGRAIKELGWDRRDIIVTTKIFFGTSRKSTHNSRGLSRKHIVEGLNKSLENLQLDYVDIVFAHRPDLTTPMEETVRAFNHVIDTGKAFYWGTSEWTPMQIQQAIEIARRLNMIAPIAEQPCYNMFQRENFESKMEPIWTREGYGSTVFSALAQGILTGKYNDGVPEDSRHKNDAKRFETEEGKAQLDKVRALTKIAEKLGTTVSNVALAWVLKHPNASTVILGATKPEQIRENVKAVEIIPKLTPELMVEIDNILDNKPKPQPSHGRLGEDGLTLV